MEGLREFYGIGANNREIWRSFICVPQKFYAAGSATLHAHSLKYAAKGNYTYEGEEHISLSNGKPYDAVLSESLGIGSNSVSTSFVFEDEDGEENFSAGDLIINHRTGEIVRVTSTTYIADTSETCVVIRALHGTEAAAAVPSDKMSIIKAEVYDCDFFKGFSVQDGDTETGSKYVKMTITMEGGESLGEQSYINSEVIKGRFTTIQRNTSAVDNTALLLIFK